MYTRLGTSISSNMWRNTKGLLHRDDGPAVEHRDGGTEWWLDGLAHREGGPSTELACGYRAWYTHGKLHCTCGPAIEYRCGRWHLAGKCFSTPSKYSPIQREWYIDGRRLTEEEFYRYVDTTTGEVLIPPGRALHYDH